LEGQAVFRVLSIHLAIGLFETFDDGLRAQRFLAAGLRGILAGLRDQRSPPLEKGLIASVAFSSSVSTHCGQNRCKEILAQTQQAASPKQLSAITAILPKWLTDEFSTDFSSLEGLEF
jgi:hypothetical protein